MLTRGSVLLVVLLLASGCGYRVPNTVEILTVSSGVPRDVSPSQAQEIEMVSKATTSFKDEIPLSVVALDSLAQRGDYEIVGMVFAGADVAAYGRPDIDDLLARLRETAAFQGADAIGHWYGAKFPTGLDCCDCVFAAGLALRSPSGEIDNRRLGFVVALLPAVGASSGMDRPVSYYGWGIRDVLQYGLAKKGYYVVPVLTDLSLEQVVELGESERDSVVGSVAGLVVAPTLVSASSGFTSQSAEVRIRIVELATGEVVDESGSESSVTIDPLSAFMGHYDEKAVCQAFLDAAMGLRGIAR